MDPVSRLYLDTNMFVAVFEAEGELSEALTRLFMSKRKGKETFLTTSELTLAEVLVEPYRQKDEELIQKYDNWTRTSTYIEVAPVDRDILWHAAVLRSRHHPVKLPDAIHLSTAIRFGCSHFLTADKRLNGRYELTDDRFGIASGPRGVEILRPERPIITELREQAAR